MLYLIPVYMGPDVVSLFPVGEDTDKDDGDEDGPEPSAREEPAHADSDKPASQLVEQPRIVTEQKIAIDEDD